MTTQNDTTKPVVREVTIQVPVAQVWKALTNADEMREWYFDLPDFKPEVGFVFQFQVEYEGHQYDHRCQVTEVIPQKKLAYTWRYEGHEGNSLVTFELFDEDDQTRLKLTHDGLDTFPKHPAFARKNFMEGWAKVLDSSLKTYLEKETT